MISGSRVRANRHTPSRLGGSVGRASSEAERQRCWSAMRLGKPAAGLLTYGHSTVKFLETHAREFPLPVVRA